jgi:hypothetical protein
MKVEGDYEELLKLFNKRKVKYCIIGAFAVGFYARPRYTKDMDILVEPSSSNGKRIVKALIDFGFRGLGLSVEDFSMPGKVIQLGYEPVRVDIITSIGGSNFSQIWRNRKRGMYGKERVYFIGLNDLIKNKKRSNRKQDQLDLDILLLGRQQRKITS